MAKVEFIYEGIKIDILCNENDIFENIINKYCLKIKKNKKDLCFLYDGKIINKNLTYNNLANTIDRNRKIMSIIVSDLYRSGNNFQKEIILLKEKLNEANKIIEQQKEEIQDLKYKITMIKSENMNQLNNLMNIIEKKDEKINQLKEQINSLNSNINNSSRDQSMFFEERKLSDNSKNQNVNNYNEVLIQVDEKEYNLDYQVISPGIKENYPYPPLICLDNIGATYYMNAILQCFCNILPFVNFFKYDKNLIYFVKNDVRKMTLSSSFKLLIEKLWPNDSKNIKKSYSPYEFKEKISKMNRLFRGSYPDDVEKLVRFFIETLHDELNVLKNNIVINNTNDIDRKNMQVMYNSFLQNFNATNQSEICRLFYGINFNIIKCQECQVASYIFQSYFFLIFPLEEIWKYKLSLNQKNSNIIINKNEVDIFNCFDHYRKINTMSGTQKKYCDYCRKTCNSLISTKLCTGPEILIIILNRGEGKQFIKINFFEILNLKDYIGMPATGFIYNLIGVITQNRKSNKLGNYIAYCKNPINNCWNKYDDSVVSPIIDFKSEVIDSSIPILLFYQKQHYY